MSAQLGYTIQWVCKAPDGSDNVYCKLCHKTLMHKMFVLTAHSKVTDQTFMCNKWGWLTIDGVSE